MSKQIDEEVLARVRQILGTDEHGLDGMDISWYGDPDNGMVSVRTPEFTWKQLYGRQWVADLKAGTYKLVSMN